MGVLGVVGCGACRVSLGGGGVSNVGRAGERLLEWVGFEVEVGADLSSRGGSGELGCSLVVFRGS